MDERGNALLAGAPAFLVRAARSIDEAATAAGCTCYVKTIYIGYELSGEMVLAVYPHPDRLEVALALPEDHASTLLIDATHLTWRSMPVAINVRTEDELGAAGALVDEAITRVASGLHAVELPNERFINSRRDRETASDRFARSVPPHDTRG